MKFTKMHGIGNDYVYVNCFEETVTKENVDKIIGECDIVIDALDNVKTRVIVSRAAENKKIPFIHGAIHGTLGQITVFSADKDINYETMFNLPSKDKDLTEDVLDDLSSVTSGVPPVIGPTPNLIGCLEAMEAEEAVKTQEEIQPGGEIPVEIYAQDTILASGGIGGRYAHSTNYPHLTGDALDIAKKHNVRLEHLDYVQIHPTTLYSKRPGRRFLISESVRGEGAVLYNSKKERFVNELLPRDVVTNAIREEMKKEGTDHVWLSMENIDKDTILNHFPNIYQRCLEEGYDVTKECIPVVPAQHYFMGGIWVDSDSKTSMDQLYAVGETSCNGVHGANRLASNSLLESLVFAKRAAKAISAEKKSAAGAA